MPCDRVTGRMELGAVTTVGDTDHPEAELDSFWRGALDNRRFDALNYPYPPFFPEGRRVPSGVVPAIDDRGTVLRCNRLPVAT